MFVIVGRSAILDCTSATSGNYPVMAAISQIQVSEKNFLPDAHAMEWWTSLSGCRRSLVDLWAGLSIGQVLVGIVSSSRLGRRGLGFILPLLVCVLLASNVEPRHAWTCCS